MTTPNGKSFMVVPQIMSRSNVGSNWQCKTAQIEQGKDNESEPTDQDSQLARPQTSQNIVTEI